MNRANRRNLRSLPIMFERVVTWAHRRRVLVLAGAACLVAVSLLGFRRLTFDADVIGLLPASGRAVPAFRTYLERFGTLDDLYVVFTAADGHEIGDYADEIDQWADALRAAPEIQRVDTGRFDESRDWSWLADRELLLLGEPTLRQALDRLRPEGMPAALDARRALLNLPSPEITALVRDDPFGLHDLLRTQLAAGQPMPGLGQPGAGYVTADRRRQLIIARPGMPPYDTGFSRRLFARLDQITVEQARRPARADGEPRPPLQVQFAGGHRIALETEAVVRRESILNGLGSLGLILPLLYGVFRSLRLVVIGALPSAAALLIVLGGLGFAGATMSAAAAGASAMLFGLGVDGVVLLYVTHRLALAEGQDAGSAIRRLAAPSASMLLGMWTTAATFLGLVVVDFPSLEQLGLLIGLSMLVCGALTLVMVPASLTHKTPANPVRPLTMPRFAAAVGSHRRTILVAAAIVTGLSAYSATSLRVNPTLDRLRSVTSGAVLFEEVSRAFGLPADVLVVLDEGHDLQPLLEANETLVAALASGRPAVRVHAPSLWLPSEHQQAARRAAIRAGLPGLDTLRTSLEQASVAAGFRPRTFDTFSARLERMIEGDARVTWQEFSERGFGDLIAQFVAFRDGRWALATYVFPATADEIARTKTIVADAPGDMVLTGLAVVNDEMSARFVPQFLLGLGAGSLVVLALIAGTFRNWRMALLTLLPTIVGLIWAAGVLALAGFELDLFSVFAVITFVGIGVDYGVHLVHRYGERGDAVRATSELAPVILVAGAITLLGYGTLIWSSYPPLHSIGVVAGASVIALVIASVLVLPATLPRGRL